MAYRSGRHFLQIPGPTNVPDAVLRAMDMPTIDHRGPDFAKLALEIFANLKPVFGAEHVIVFPSSGTGAWEAAIVNTLQPGDKVLMFETGHFATLWRSMANNFGLEVDFVPGDWRRGVDPQTLESKLREDPEHKIKAVMVVHNETSTGVTSRIPLIRQAMDNASHPALLMVDTISSLGSMPYLHDEWGVDVTVSCSQKGLMLPPGLGFNAISEKALKIAENGGMPRSYWDWHDMLAANRKGFTHYTPATNLLYGLRKALEMLLDEGMENVFLRHARHGEATRRAVRGWGLEILCQEPEEYSNVLTAVLMPEGHDADEFWAIVLDRFDMSLGAGLTKLSNRVFRIGHLGALNDLSLTGTLSGVEMGLSIANVPHNKGGITAAMTHLAETASG